MSKIKALKNPYPNREYNIHIEFPEFTCVCPKTSLPDFANIIIDYVPDKKIVELKSLKLYFVSYRNLGMFHEKVINKVLEDLAAAFDRGADRERLDGKAVAQREGGPQARRFGLADPFDGRQLPGAGTGQHGDSWGNAKADPFFVWAGDPGSPRLCVHPGRGWVAAHALRSRRDYPVRSARGAGRRSRPFN